MGPDTHPQDRKGKERVQLDFSADSLERLEKLKERVGASTRAEVIRQALRLYEWFINETEPESTVLILDRENEIAAKFKASLLHNETRPK
jgi:metal-responsive CopG/Arc/MetJ family transcriptional regulator